ncbi:MAG: amino acid ABC transporter substrate-binding protein, partial [Spirochaetales bacterium]|nr:amino acid ABC transporter substrate-binding protein [Spirochaetales bacterium]
ADGRLDKWLNKWLGSDESVKTVDYDNLDSPNGVVSLVTIDTNEPFEYIKDNKIVGYEIECVTEFCKEFGDGLNVTAVNFDSLLAALSAGTYDCGASMLLPLDERRESLYFSIPNVRDKVVAVVRKSNDNKPTENVKKGFTSIKDFNRSGIRIGLSSGSTFDIIADEHYPKAEKLYFNTFGDIVKALQDGLIDMSMFDEPVAIDMCRQTDNLTYISDYIETTDFAFCFARDEKSDKLLKEFNAF